MKRSAPARGGIFPYHAKGARLWALDYIDPLTGRKRRKTQFRNRGLAVKYRDKTDKEAAGLLPVGDDRLLFDDLVKRFLAEYQTRSGRIDYYEERSKVWLEFMGGLLAERVTARDVAKLKRARMAKCSSSTVRKDLVSLSTLFRWARAHNLVSGNPTDPQLVRRPAKDRPDPRPLSAVQVRRLLRACPAWLRTIVEFCIETGVDRAEALSLTWGQIDRSRKTIRLDRAKTDQPRTIPYRGNEAITRILKSAASLRQMTGVVFVRDGEPIAVEAARTVMRATWETTLPLHPRPWKSLRATFATRMIERGTSVADIAALMGLSSLHVMEHYYRPRAAHLEAAMATPRRRVGVDMKKRKRRPKKKG